MYGREREDKHWNNLSEDAKFINAQFDVNLALLPPYTFFLGGGRTLNEKRGRKLNPSLLTIEKRKRKSVIKIDGFATM